METIIPQVKELKEFLYTDGKLVAKRVVRPWIKSRCPELYKYFEEHFNENQFSEFIYCIIHGLDEIPLCPICGKPLSLRNFIKGFQTTCSKDCANTYFKQNKEVHQKISATKRAQQTKQAKWLYDYDFSIDGNNYTIFHNYCKHGDVKIYNRIMYKIHDIGESSFCLKCNLDTYNEYQPTDEEITKFQEEFPEFHREYHNALSWDFWIRYFPKKLKILTTYFEKYFRKFDKDKDLSEVYYVFLNKMTEYKKCPICGENITSFYGTPYYYATHCNKHLYSTKNSTGEEQLRSYIQSLGFNVETNRSVLSGKEIDCYIPEKKIGFEYNGCYYHSSECTAPDAHVEKKHLATESGIDLYFIWEDDWINKNEICKSLIASKLGVYKERIYARNCELKPISYRDAYSFITDNHLHRYSVATTKLGLFYKDELVSVMTFGKSRFAKDEYEIIRFCNKLNTQVIGGASKLFKYFSNNYLLGQKCSSYAYNDISNGNLYEKLGFTKVSEGKNWTWLYKGLRYNRLNKIKNEEGLLKCYSSGVSKFSIN